MATVLISLGGNAGSVADRFRTVLMQLDERPRIRVDAASPFYETSAVTLAGEDSPVFLNAAARLTTDYSPLEMLAILQRLEFEAGRISHGRWSTRPLDIDLLFYGDVILSTDRLTIPHPAAWYRRFVLDPLQAIAPDFVHPLKQRTLVFLRDRLLTRPLTIGMTGISQREFQQSRDSFPFSPETAQLVIWKEGDGEPTFLIDGSGDGGIRSRLPALPLVEAWPREVKLEEFLRILASSALGADV